MRKPLSEVHYNAVPKGFREITETEFCHAFFGYCFKDAVDKQVHWDEKGNELKESFTSIKFWEVDYQDWEGMGVAMAGVYKSDYPDSTYTCRYFKFGEEKRWKENEAKFCAQFANDNS